MRYEQPLFRPPSEGNALILQATIGCSWNHCTYCAMYLTKKFRVRSLEDCLSDLRSIGGFRSARVQKLFVADGDALVLPMAHWREILKTARKLFPNLRRVSCYATARNLLEKTVQELKELREFGLSLLYIGPESGDDETLRSIAKGANFEEHVEAANRLHAAGMKQSMIALLGAGGIKRSEAHAHATAKLVTAMDPSFFSALTLTVVPNTPQAKLQKSGRFTLPDPIGLLKELRIMVAESAPTSSIFRTNHASNYLPLGGTLSVDRDKIVARIDAALEGNVRLRPEWSRGL